MEGKSIVEKCPLKCNRPTEGRLALFLLSIRQLETERGVDRVRWAMDRTAEGVPLCEIFSCEGMRGRGMHGRTGWARYGGGREGRKACNLGADRVQKASQICNHRLEILSTVQVDPLHAPEGFLRVSLILDPITPRQVAPLCNDEHAQHLPGRAREGISLEDSKNWTLGVVGHFEVRDRHGMRVNLKQTGFEPTTVTLGPALLEVAKELSMHYLVELPALSGFIHQIQKSLRGLLHWRIPARLFRNTESCQGALEIGIFLPSDERKELTPGNAILEWRGVCQYSNAVRGTDFHTLQNRVVLEPPW